MKGTFWLLLFLLAGLNSDRCHSQELEPGFLSTMPTGGNIAIASYGFSFGDILIDKSLPIEGLNSRLNILGVGYFRSFKLFNRLAKFDVVLPFAFGKFNGLLEGQPESVSRQGFGDPLVRLSMILLGADPLKPQEYFKQEQKKFKLGFAMRFQVPLGQYDPEKLLNLGANRWALRTALAGSYTLKEKLVLEAHLTSWFFSENDNFFGGNTSKQEPLYGVQFHATYIFKPGMWIAGSLGGVWGGVTAINGADQPALNNSRIGLAFAYRLKKGSSLKFAYTNAFITTFGGDYDTFLLAYQFLWFDKKKEGK